MSSIGARLTAWYVLIITGTLALVLVVGGLLLRLELLRSVDLLNAAQFKEIAQRVANDQLRSPEGDFLEQVSAQAKIDPQNHFFQVYASDGTILYRSENLGNETLPAAPIGETQWTAELEDLGQLRVAAFAAGTDRIEIGTSLSTVSELFRVYFQVSALMLISVAILSFFLGYWMSRLALDPLRKIEKTASRISAENLKERIPVSNVRDEISDLARLLNQTFDQLEKAFARLSRFAGDASHELKTPLAIIRLQSEKLLVQGGLPPAHQEALQQQLRSIQGLNLVIEKLLFLARAESGVIKAQQKQQSTADFISCFVEDALVLCEDRGVRFELLHNEDAEVPFDASLVRQVLLNLLSNSLKVTLINGEITLDSVITQTCWRVTVEDTGPGIVENESPEKIVAAEGGFTKGSGLGLAICRGIVELHRGQMQIENRKPGPGLRVVIELPRHRT